MPFPNSALIRFLLGAPPLVPSCGLGQGSCREPQHSAHSGWTLFLSSAHVTCGMDKAGADPHSVAGCASGVVPCRSGGAFGHWFLLTGPSPSRVTPPA